ncbi:hypothetical protein R9C00_11135 [Flammeovirgaceae bacterium SG7u.111]|nr:hypothetical protein [Flammeovirgaceae bacterium SG7u.132]WPO38005.1 hypothetical protein R9C00_11135 [Flammeovirgaceae bacterium SG7u.111]
MKTIFLLLITCLLLGACAEKSSTSEDTALDALVTDVVETAPVVASADMVKPQPQPEETNDYLTVEAQFMYFSLGDASHYVFEDATGKGWSFGGCNAGVSFEEGLSEAEANMDNQGWGSNKELQGKWFKLSYTEEERQLYIDGPMGVVEIIQKAEPIEKPSKVYKSKTGFPLEAITMEAPVEGFVHMGNKNPEGTVELESEEMEPSSYRVTVKSTGVDRTIFGTVLSPVGMYWPEYSEYVVLDNADTYAGSGTYSIVVLNTESGAYTVIDKEQLLEGVDVGDREMLNIKNIVWVNNYSFSIDANVSYLGYSGHPGIDQNRKTKLGEKFADTVDVVTLPIKKYRIVGDLNTLQNKSAKTLNKEVDHYICYNSEGASPLTLWISFNQKNEAIEVKYKGQKEGMELVFAREEIVEGQATIVKYYHEMYRGNVNGTYKLTHSGIWDYAEYTSGKNRKVTKFTIDHDANPYGKEPCF